MFHWPDVAEVQKVHRLLQKKQQKQRQQKKQKEIAKFRNELKKGDKIVTIGGIYGTVDEIREKYVIIVVDGDVKLRVDKSAIVKDMSDVPAK